MIIGVDLGNYAVKTSENLHFLSKVIESNGFYGDKEICFEGKKDNSWRRRVPNRL